MTLDDITKVYFGLVELWDYYHNTKLTKRLTNFECDVESFTWYRKYATRQVKLIEVATNKNHQYLKIFI